jgi:hypothetical protein
MYIEELIFPLKREGLREDMNYLFKRRAILGVFGQMCSLCLEE